MVCSEFLVTQTWITELMHMQTPVQIQIKKPREEGGLSSTFASLDHAIGDVNLYVVP